jgi:hypothetical protein
MSTIVTSCMNAIRNIPQGSAVDIPWGWMEQHGLTESSVIFPTFDPDNENKITQTVARLFFAVILPRLAKPFGYANLGLGAIQFVWCVLNIKKIRNKEDGCSPQDIESALIRLFTGAYDLGIAYILYSTRLNTIYVKTFLVLAVALVPKYPIQLHHFIFEKATKKIEGTEQQLTEENITEIDHRALKVGCLIKQFCNGLVEAFAPTPPELPKSFSDRAWALPTALGTFGRATYATLRGPTLPVEQKPVEST